MLQKGKDLVSTAPESFSELVPRGPPLSQQGLLTSLDPGGGGGGGKQAIFPFLLLNLVWTEQSSRNSPFPALGSSIPGAQGPELDPVFCPAGQPTPVHPRAPEESQILRSQRPGRTQGARRKQLWTFWICQDHRPSSFFTAG